MYWGIILFTFKTKYPMSTEQTYSRKGKVQIPEGWSPTSGEQKGNPAEPTNEEEETKFQETLKEKLIEGVSTDRNATNERETSTSTDVTIEPKYSIGNTDSLQTESSEPTDAPRSTVSTNAKRTSGKQRKESLEEYRQTFLCIPKLEDRKPVFVSREVRDSLDEIARKLGGRRMSVSGFIENLARHHLELYHEDIETWKKL
ncbi:hypothetical protein AGMMS49574_18250 [Bacteroidia bacterium]|nr:hypothetical protein AGMMS49574_18250 [Bacteroidia bacterium]